MKLGATINSKSGLEELFSCAKWCRRWSYELGILSVRKVVQLPALFRRSALFMLRLALALDSRAFLPITPSFFVYSLSSITGKRVYNVLWQSRWSQDLIFLMCVAAPPSFLCVCCRPNGRHDGSQRPGNSLNAVSTPKPISLQAKISKVTYWRTAWRSCCCR